eukprot:14154988-Alexandrium_andersonii.AAC.1
MCIRDRRAGALLEVAGLPAQRGPGARRRRLTRPGAGPARAAAAGLREEVLGLDDAATLVLDPAELAHVAGGQEAMVLGLEPLTP